MTKNQILMHLIRGKKITLKKLFNLFRGYFYYRIKNTKPGSLPAILMVEPTNFCNLSCPLCPTGNKSLKRARGFMEFNSFTKIIDELGDYLMNLTLWNYGEPMLHKNIYDMIEYAKNKKIFVRLSTNGHFFSSPENAERLVKSRLDDLIISLDGASQETLSKYRLGANFEEIINGIKSVIAAKKKLQSKLPFIEVQFVVMKHNEHEVNKIKEIAGNIGIDKLTLKTANLEMDRTDPNPERMEKFLPTEEYHSRYVKNEGGLKIKKSLKNKCVRLWLSSVVNWNGDVVPCCYDPEGIFTFGNAFQAPFKKIWLNDKYAKFREAVLKNKNNIKMCANCPGTLLGTTLD